MNCLACGVEIFPPKINSCGRICRKRLYWKKNKERLNAERRKHPLPALQEGCANCGEAFYRSSQAFQKYCNARCARRAQKKRYDQRHPEKIREHQRKHYQLHKDELNKRAIIRYYANREKILIGRKSFVVVKRFQKLKFLMQFMLLLVQRRWTELNSAAGQVWVGVKEDSADLGLSIYFQEN